MERRSQKNLTKNKRADHKNNRCSVEKAPKYLLEEEVLLSQIKSTTNIDTEILEKRKCKPGTIKKNSDQIRQHTIAFDDVNTQLSANPIDIFQEPDKSKAPFTVLRYE